jgi:hypothetical protein
MSAKTMKMYLNGIMAASLAEGSAGFVIAHVRDSGVPGNG